MTRKSDRIRLDRPRDAKRDRKSRDLDRRAQRRAKYATQGRAAR